MITVVRSKVNPSMLHLAKHDRSGKALCGDGTNPTDIAVTAWGRPITGESSSRFCAICDQQKDRTKS
jgi:hypothetical protein